MPECLTCRGTSHLQLLVTQLVRGYSCSAPHASPLHLRLVLVLHVLCWEPAPASKAEYQVAGSSCSRVVQHPHIASVTAERMFHCAVLYCCSWIGCCGDAGRFIRHLAVAFRHSLSLPSSSGKGYNRC